MIHSKAILAGLLATATFALADSWTLEQCLEQAKKSSLKLESAKLREQQADVSIKMAKAGKHPTLSASINNSLYDRPLADHPQDHYSLSLGINGSWTLWDGGSVALATEASKLNKDAAAFNTKQVERTIQESVLNAYMNLLAAEEKLLTANSSLELSQAELEHYTRLYEAGAITKKDLVQSQSNVMQKQVAILQAQQSVNSSKTSLKQLLELPASDSLSVEAPANSASSPDSLDAIPSLEQILLDAQKANPGLKADSIAIQAARKNVEVAGKGSTITVSLGASSSTGLQAWQSDRYGTQLKDRWQNSVSLGINIPIIDNGSTENKVLQAQLNETESQVTLQEAAKVLENSIEQLYLNALSADLQWKAAILQVEAYTEALTVAEEQRNAGAITYTDYLIQKNNLESSKVTLTNAKYTSLLARKLLDLYQGKLD
ncbi:MAG: TolC family protein [Fibrobacter sp.]|nr:TolC family protein [Fibrobacter sp.]